MPPSVVPWPVVADVDSKTLGAVALELALSRVAAKVRENGVNNRGVEVDSYNAAVGLPVPSDPTRQGFPWCTSGALACFVEAARQKGVTCPFPLTAKAVEVRNRSDQRYLVSNPVPGAVIVLDHGKGWADELATGKRLTDNGHIAISLATLDGDVSGNTNEAGSREGNAWAVKKWPDGGDAAAVHGGLIVGIFDFSLELV